MYGIKEVGRFNVDYAGFSYDGNIKYNMVIFEEFNENEPVQGSRKTLYFLAEKNCMLPNLKNEQDVEMFLKYRNYSKLAVRTTITTNIEVLK